MITAHRIGSMGQLGNQMFQYATLIGISTKTGFEPVLPIENTTPKIAEYNSAGKPISYALCVQDCFDVPIRYLSLKEIPIYGQYNEPFHQFCGNIFTIPDGTSIVGFFETEKYFEHCRDEIRKHFIFKKEIVDLASKKYQALQRGKKLVCLHIRHHTQYSNTIVHHPYVPLDYYHQAIKMFPESEYDLLMFTDRADPEESFDYKNMIYNTWEKDFHRPDFVDLCLMSMCDHHIIANSSFSWWGAWLANKPNQIIIAPKVWFGPGLAHKNTDDIIPSRWIKI